MGKLNRKHEMFLNACSKSKRVFNSLLNRKHEMFLNSKCLLHAKYSFLLNRKHEMFLNIVQNYNVPSK